MSKMMRNFVALLGVLGALGVVACGEGSQQHSTGGTARGGSGGDGAGGSGAGGSGSSSSGAGTTSSGTAGGLVPCMSQDLDGLWQVEATGSDPIYWQCDSASSSFTLSIYEEVMPVQSPPQFDEAQWTGKFMFQAPGEVAFEPGVGSCPALPTNTYACVVGNGTLTFEQLTGAGKGTVSVWVKNPPPPPTNIAAHCGS